MAKDGPHIEILLRSTAETGCAHATTKHRRTPTTRLELRPHAPVVRRHVVFREIEA
jgi:ribosomal protein L33